MKRLRTGFENPSGTDVLLGTGMWRNNSSYGPTVETNKWGRTGQCIRPDIVSIGSSSDGKYFPRLPVHSAGISLTGRVAVDAYNTSTSYFVQLLVWRSGTTMHHIGLRGTQLIYVTSTYSSSTYRWGAISSYSGYSFAIVATKTLSATPASDTWYPYSIEINNTEIKATFDSQELLIAGPFTWNVVEAALGATMYLFGRSTNNFDDIYTNNDTYAPRYDDLAINDTQGTIDNGLPNFIRAIPTTYAVDASGDWSDTANLNNGNPNLKAGANGTLKLGLQDSDPAYTGVEGVNAIFENTKGEGAAIDLLGVLDNGVDVSDAGTYNASASEGDRNLNMWFGKTADGGDWSNLEWDTMQFKLTVTP